MSRSKRRLIVIVVCVIAAAAFILPWSGVDMAVIRDWLGITHADVVYEVTRRCP